MIDLSLGEIPTWSNLHLKKKVNFSFGKLGSQSFTPKLVNFSLERIVS